MFALARLPLPVPEEYWGFTYPTYRPLLSSSREIVAIGVQQKGAGVGLGLARVDEAQRRAELLSIAVAPAFRREGIGTAILAQLEEELRGRCGRVDAVYTDGTPSSAAVTRILQKCGWEPIRHRMMICRTQLDLLLSAPWMQKSYLPPAFSIFPWCTLTPEEESDVRAQRYVQYAEPLSPFVDSENIEKDTSLGLRYEGKVVGWIITHLVSADTLRVTRMWVRSDLQKRGRAVSLISESMKRYKQGMGDSAPNGIFDVHVENRPMMEFARRRLAPYLTGTCFSYGTSKVLSA